MYLLGFDIGSSSVKAALVDADTKEVKEVVSAPSREMPIDSLEKGFAEQDPQMWWKYVCECSCRLMKNHPEAADKILSIGLAYQMHGLVVVDQKGQVLRPSIIWSDSRAVTTGKAIEEELDRKDFLESHYNLPGNFTFSKLRWVLDHQPDIFDQIDKIMLPGDYIAWKMTGEIRTSITGLSEGILWNFRENAPAFELMERFGMSSDLLPEFSPSFSVSGYLHEEGAASLGISAGKKVAVSYRSGDQPNNAWSLGVNEAGMMAGTGGTSAVLYGISETEVIDKSQRTNTFAHVNYEPGQPVTGTLLNISGAGILYSWIRKNIVGTEISYTTMEERARRIRPGSDGMLLLPFGNGAERMLGNRTVNAHLLNVDLNRHSADHIIRAGLEGVGFAYVYGFEIMKKLGFSVHKMRVGNDNLFQSGIFSGLISDLCNIEIEVVEVTGAVGAALGSGVGCGYYKNTEEGKSGGEIHQTIAPRTGGVEQYHEVYENWKKGLNNKIN